MREQYHCKICKLMICADPAIGSCCEGRLNKLTGIDGGLKLAVELLKLQMEKESAWKHYHDMAGKFQQVTGELRELKKRRGVNDG